MAHITFLSTNQSPNPRHNVLPFNGINASNSIRSFIRLSCLYILLVSMSLGSVRLDSATQDSPIDKDDRFSQGYRGWSSWSLQAFRGAGYGFAWLNEAHVKAQADVISKSFREFGFNRINLDSGWQDNQLDQYGRAQLNRTQFPSGIESLRAYLNERGLQLGLYYLPGIDARAVEQSAPVLGTDYKADQLIHCPGPKGVQPPATQKSCQRPLANAFKAGYALNYSHPGSQPYINSIVEQFYEWNISFVKLDGNVPGSSFNPSSGEVCDTRPDLLGWRKAIDERYERKWNSRGRSRIWMVASWELPVEAGPVLDQAVDSWRVATDIEAYDTVMTTFDRVVRNARKAAFWSSIEENRNFGGYLDLDTVSVSDMTLEACRSMVTIWVMFGTPFYLGDDLTKLPSERRALLTNPEVLEIQRLTGTNPARLENYQPSFAALTQKTVASANDLRDAADDCATFAKKRALVAQHLNLPQLDLNAEVDKCPKAGAVLQSQAAEATEPTEWTRQIWVVEHKTGEIFLAIVNAGKQVKTDTSIEFDLSLSQIQVLSSWAKQQRSHYKVRDVWKGNDLKTIGFEDKLHIKLERHDSVIFRLTPV